MCRFVYTWYTVQFVYYNGQLRLSIHYTLIIYLGFDNFLVIITCVSIQIIICLSKIVISRPQEK